MKVIFTVFLLSLSISSVFTTEKHNKPITIIKAKGDLYEYFKSQEIELSIAPLFNIDLKKLYDFVLTRAFKSYKIPLNCLKVKNQLFSSLVTCKIDLSKIPMGTYLISTFNYSNITYISTASIKIKEVDDKKISDIKLTDVKSNQIEYKSYATPFKLYFSDKVDPKKLVTLKMEDKDKNEYKISIVNCKKCDNLIECSGVFNYKAGIYKVIYVQYDKEIIKPSKNLNFNILEDIINIESVYHSYSNEICAGELNHLHIYFDNYMECIYLSKIFLKNVKTNIIYEPRFSSIFNPTNGASSLQFMLDLYGIPPGKYYVDYIYKRRMTKTKYILEVKHCEPFDYSKIYGN